MILICLVVLSLVTGFSANDCNFEVNLEQGLLNEGFHRNITYKVEFRGDVNGNLFENCIVGLEQSLPVGVFANPDELGDLKRLHKLSAIPKNRVNVELPAEQSLPTSVFIISKLVGNIANTWLPVHARYHHPTYEGGYANNDIQPPLLFLRCPDRRLEKCDKTPSYTFLCNAFSKDKCSWRQLPVNVLTTGLSIQVPVGNTSSFLLVLTVTASVIVVGSLHLLKTLHEYNLINKKT